MTGRRRSAAICLALGLALVVAGAGLAGRGGYIHAKAWVAQLLLADAWRSTLAVARRVKHWPWADSWPFDRLSVPRIGVELVVLSEASGRSLAFGPGHLPETAPPGAAGASVIAGHRDTHFRFLQDLAPGEPIVLETADGRRQEFRAGRGVVTDHASVRLRLDGPEPSLVLVTCWPFDAVVPGGPQRYLVTATR